MKTSRRPLKLLATLTVLILALPVAVAAQESDQTFATYITDQQWRSVNTLPGIDRQIVSRDIGDLNLSVGIIHREATGPSDPPGPTQGTPECGVTSGEFSGASGISHDHQTETYIIVSGGGVLVTGGEIQNGTASGPESSVTTTLNGPSCFGAIVGDWEARNVTVGDIVIIPEGTPHGWLSVPDHVDYLSVRPDPQRVLPDDYVNPALEGAIPEIKITP